MNSVVHMLCTTYFAPIVCTLLICLCKLTVVSDGLTGNADATCMATEADSIDWLIVVESTNFNLNIDSENILRSTREDLVIEEGLVMSSVLGASSINQDLNSITSSLLILSSFMPGHDILLTCNARAFSQTQSASSSIQRDSTDLTSELYTHQLS